MDENEDWVIMLEGHDAEVVDDLARSTFSPDALLALGANAGARLDRFKLAHLLEANELRSQS
jgi:hypothetical protein